MKKLLVLGAGILLPAAASADTLLGVYAGAQGWNYPAEGGFANDKDVSDFNYDHQVEGSFYIALEHPIPLLPNIKLRRTNLVSDGKTTLSSGFSFGSESFSSGSDVATKVDLSNTDYTFYYELFDNTIVSLDVGLNIKDVDGQIYAEDTDSTAINGQENVSGYIPMLYARTEFGLPGLNWGVYAEGNFLAFDGHSVSDYQLAMTYDLLDNLIVDMTAQVGYRAFKLKLDDLDGVYTDLDFNGPFVGVEVHF